MDFYTSLLDLTGFYPRWTCGKWTPLHGWIHIASDLATFFAYSLIPIILAFFLLKRKDMPFNRLLWLFSAFLFSCGASHLIDASIFWEPYYRLSAVIKIITAAIAWVTLIHLNHSYSLILAFPSASKVNFMLNQAHCNLNRVNQGLKDFVNIASHHLKKPLAQIKEIAERFSIESKPKLPLEEQEKIDRIIRQTHRMSDLIQTLEHYTRFGLEALPKEELSLNQLLVEVAESISAALEQKNGLLTIQPALPKVYGNSVALREVFYNLIANGLKYNDKKTPLIKVGKVPNTPETTFFVQDNGIGIAEKHFQSIFRIFKRLQDDDRYGAGHGAGLTIVKKIIESHGGRIWLSSKLQEGTTFYFTLASKNAPQEPSPTQKA
ncbi:MAG: two-component sensor histidine kinase [Chlamydiales bacterium]|jgi:signal transduction histidine kinase|nr:two-component sensor histidine kinase [Chlamydiales bacterium]